MIRNLLSYATLASLAACSQGESDTAADTEASTPAAVGGEAVTAYEPFFDQRWPQGVPVTPEEVSAILDEQGAQAIEAMATALLPTAGTPCCAASPRANPAGSRSRPRSWPAPTAAMAKKSAWR